VGQDLMVPDDTLLSYVGQTSRQLVVGDLIQHPTLGTGLLVSGWEGYLKIEFSSGLKIFTDKDGLCLMPSDLHDGWILLDLKDVGEWSAKLSRNKEAALVDIRVAFQADFIHSDEVFNGKASRYLTCDEYQREKVLFVQRWVAGEMFGSNGKNMKTPDFEQALAISSVLGHVQVVARAGSGKTETVANRAVFLQKHCGVAPSEMLLLAFNKDAAKEMVERVKVKLNGDVLPHIMTFHALAYAIVPGAKQLLVNQTGGDQSLNQEFQQVLMDAIEDPDFELRVRQLMLAHFRADWERIVSGGYNLSCKEMLLYRRSLASETLRGEYVKSYGEKLIANFLFEHDIPYGYEQNHWWNGLKYRPDFTIPKRGSMAKGVIVEYFGMQGDLDYDEQSARKRAHWATKSNEWIFVELGVDDFAGGASCFERLLSKSLSDAKVQLVKLSEDEIWRRMRDRYIYRFTETMSDFVGRCRKKWITPDKLRTLMGEYHPITDIEAWFLEISIALYESYLARLEATDSEDFDGLVQNAVSLIESGKSSFTRKNMDGDLSRIRYVFVDEYQDFTELFHRLLSAIRHLNPNAALFCVGDDWQAINSYAGSDLKYYEQFSSIFDPSVRLGISANRRSTQSVVVVSNALMEGRGKAAIASSMEVGLVVLVDLAKFRPTFLEESLFKKSLLTPVVLRLAGKALGEGKSVVLLSAKNNLIDPGGGQTPLDIYLKMLKSKLPKPLHDGLSISTIHGFKGQESDVVIILDAFDRSYPMIHPNWIFSRILGESIEAIIDEARRLFYVALTRAKKQVLIITEQSKKSPFLDEITEKYFLPEVDWNLFPPVVAGKDWVSVKISGSYKAIQPLIYSLKSDGFQYHDLSRVGGQRSWDRSFRVTELVDGFLIDSPWMTLARGCGLSGVAVMLYDDMDQCIMTCEIDEGELRISSGGTIKPFDLAQLLYMFRTASTGRFANEG
jgi:DNA helicase-4